MADQILILPDDSGNLGKKLDTSSLTVGANTVNRERHNIADPTTAAALAAVTNSAPNGSAYGLVTWNQPSGTQKEQASDGTNAETTLFDLDTGAGAQFARGVNLRISGNGGSIEAKGQQAMANSIPAVIASDQTALPVKAQTSTTGGASIYHVVSAATTNLANIKASAGQVYGWSIFNNAGYPIYVKFHNTAGTPTAGSGVVHTLGVQAGSSRELFLNSGISFSTGIGISIVKDITDAGTTAVALSDCVVDIYYA